MREIIGLQCDSCKNRNYTTKRNKKLKPGKMETKKFCPFCRTHTLHKEVKV